VGKACADAQSLPGAPHVGKVKKSPGRALEWPNVWSEKREVGVTPMITAHVGVSKMTVADT
jgi:hypothetical protein